MIEGVFLKLLAGIGWTLAITGCAFIIGAILALPLALLRRSKRVVIRWLFTVVIELIRAVPPVVWLFLLYYAVVIGEYRFDTFTAAIIGFGVISGAYLAEVYRAAFAAVPRGQWEAAAALGLHGHRLYTKVIFPQAVLLAVPPAATYAIGLLKDSAIASIIGASDVTFYALETARQTGNGLTIFLVAALIYLLLSIPIAILARAGGAWLERKLRA